MRRLALARFPTILVVVGLISAVAGVGLAASAPPQPRAIRSGLTRPRVDVMADYTAAGNPSLVANFSPDGSLAKPRWAIWPSAQATSCRPVRSRSQFLQPGVTRAGTVFQARATYRGKVYTARSATWLGTVRSTGAPWLSGAPRYGQAMIAHPGAWVGGWQAIPGDQPSRYDSSEGRSPSFDVLNVEACRTATGQGCVNLTAPGPVLFSTRAPVLGAGVTGRYLFAFDQHLASDVAFAGVGYGHAASIPPVKLNSTTTRSAALGPVRGPARPVVSILAHARRHDDQILVARVRCSVRCGISVQALARRHASSGHTTTVGIHLIGVPSRGLQDGQLKVLLFVSDAAAIRGTSRLGSG